MIKIEHSSRATTSVASYGQQNNSFLSVSKKGCNVGIIRRRKYVDTGSLKIVNLSRQIARRWGKKTDLEGQTKRSKRSSINWQLHIQTNTHTHIHSFIHSYRHTHKHKITFLKDYEKTEDIKVRKTWKLWNWYIDANQSCKKKGVSTNLLKGADEFPSCSS